MRHPERELYYVYPHHFQTQQQCNNAILECASLLGVEREDLNLRASSRGLYAGVVRVLEPGIGEIDGISLSDPMPISSNWITNPEVHCDPTGAQFILVIEKEGIFDRLHQDRFWRRLPCVLVTGRGFPDLATRALVHQLSTRFSLPVYGLADCNPFGLALLLTYKLGSAVRLPSLLLAVRPVPF